MKYGKVLQPALTSSSALKEIVAISRDMMINKIETAHAFGADESAGRSDRARHRGDRCGPTRSSTSLPSPDRKRRGAHGTTITGAHFRVRSETARATILADRLVATGLVLATRRHHARRGAIHAWLLGAIVAQKRARRCLVKLSIDRCRAAAGH